LIAILGVGYGVEKLVNNHVNLGWLSYRFKVTFGLPASNIMVFFIFRNVNRCRRIFRWQIRTIGRRLNRLGTRRLSKNKFKIVGVYNPAQEELLCQL